MTTTRRTVTGDARSSDGRIPATPAVPPARMDLLGRRFYRRLTQQAPPASHGVLVEYDLPIVMSDDVTLLADHYAPQGPDLGSPVVLIRTPYGRAGVGPTARIFAERGHHVLVQSCRGHFGSGGTFNPFFDEEQDGHDTVAWIDRQPWSSGSVHTFGPSYLGLTQFSLTQRPPASLRSMTVIVSALSFADAIVHHHDGFGMETALTWNIALRYMERSTPTKLWAQLRARTGIVRAADTIPPTDAVRAAIGVDVPFFRDWLAHQRTDPWWDPIRFGEQPTTVPPTVLVAGWYDLFGHAQLDDFTALRAAGRPVRLVAGPWTHMMSEPGEQGTLEALRQLDEATPGAATSEVPAVRIQPIGSAQWHTFAEWPPPAEHRTLVPTADGRLAEPDSGENLSPATTLGYTYDPADPTPMAGGRSLNPFTAGRRNQSARESRGDVLCWTSGPLANRTLIAGDVLATIVVSSTNPTADLFVRLCEVDTRGRSSNITDGYLRLDRPAGDTRAAEDREPGAARTVELALAGTAAEIPAGHRLRLQVSSGSHPLHLRNPGTADPVNDFSRLIPSDQRIFLGPNGTRLTIPVVTG